MRSRGLTDFENEIRSQQRRERIRLLLFWFRRRIPLVILLSLSVVALYYLLQIAYALEWTGFGATVVNGVERPARTLWDWLNLFIAPAVLAGGGVLISSTIRRIETEREHSRRDFEQFIIEHDRRETLVDSYVSYVMELVHSPDFAESSALKVAVTIKTRLILRRLPVKPISPSYLQPMDFRNELSVGLTDNHRRGVVLTLLYDLELISLPKPTIILQNMDFSMAMLNGALLANANLATVDLSGAALIGASLHNASLRYSNLSYAVLYGADLRGVDLTGASCKGAIFEKRFEDSVPYIAKAFFDETTILPSGEYWSPNTDLGDFI